MDPAERSVRAFYRGKTVFLTGATGFVGRFLVYKMLKDLEIRRIYICLRTKKGVAVDERERQFKNLELFSYLPDKSLLDKVTVMAGDVNLPNLGLSETDLQTVYEEVNIVYHSAATVRFNEDLKVASTLHILGTKYVIDISKRIKNLDILVHLSSVGAWCANDVLVERIPEPPYEPLEFANKFLNMTNEEAKACEKDYIGKRPKYMNSYTLTKSLAECVVAKEAAAFKKVIVVRPPFILSPVREPELGWFDEPQTGAGLGALFSLGLLRMGNLRLDYPVEAVPVDMCVNALITLPWYMVQKSEKSLQVFNMSSSRDRPVTGRDMFGIGIRLGYLYPSTKQIRPPVEEFHYVPTRAYVWIKAFFTHTLFSLMIDFLLLITGQKPMMYKLTTKVVNAVRQIFETMNDYKEELIIEMGNLDLVYSSSATALSNEERKIFEYNLLDIDWIKCGYANHLRFRRHVLKEPDSTLEYARKRLKVIDVLYRVFKLMVWVGVAAVIYAGHLLFYPMPLLWIPWAVLVSVGLAIMIYQ